MALADEILKQNAGGRSTLEDVELTDELAQEVEVLGNNSTPPVQGASPMALKSPSIGDLIVGNRDPVQGVPEDDDLTAPGAPAPSELKELGANIQRAAKAISDPTTQKLMSDILGVDFSGGRGSGSENVSQAQQPQSQSDEQGLGQRILGAVRSTLSNRDFQRFLISIGSEISGSTGAIGNLGNQLISGSAQSEFREGLESGDLGPGADVDGLLPQGREAVLQSFRAGQEQDRRDEEQDRRERLTDLKFDQQEFDEFAQTFDMALRAEELSIAERGVVIEEAAAEVGRRLTRVRADLLEVRTQGERVRNQLLREGKTEGSITQDAQSVNETIKLLDTNIEVAQESISSANEVLNNQNLRNRTANPNEQISSSAQQRLREARETRAAARLNMQRSQIEADKLRLQLRGDVEGFEEVGPVVPRSVSSLSEGNRQTLLERGFDPDDTVGVITKYNPETEETKITVQRLAE